MPRLRRADCSGPGIERRRRGRGFEYVDGETGEKIVEREVLQRIADLAVPPAWSEVWICPFPNGHIQAVGTDAAGRRQYLYHETWRQRRDQEKFDRMLHFARALPRLRDACAVHLASDGMPRARALACAARLLDQGFFRIGTESYAEENGTYGIATMKRAHATLGKRAVVFDYPAKGGKRHVRAIVDPAVYEVVAQLKKRRGGSDELLAYKVGRRWTDVKSSDINEFLKKVTGVDCTAKDFRTWNATVLAAVAICVSGEVAASKTGRKRAEARAVSEVAHYLGNTPAVCRASYIDPRVFDRYRSGWTIAGVIESLGEVDAFGDSSIQGPVEEAVIDLLEDNRLSDALERTA